MNGAANDMFEQVIRHRRRKERLFLIGTPVVVALALVATWLGGTQYVAANCVEEASVLYCPESWRSVRAVDGPNMAYVPVERIADIRSNRD